MTEAKSLNTLKREMMKAFRSERRYRFTHLFFSDAAHVAALRDQVKEACFAYQRELHTELQLNHGVDKGTALVEGNLFGAVTKVSAKIKGAPVNLLVFFLNDEIKVSDAQGKALA